MRERWNAGHSYLQFKSWCDCSSPRKTSVRIVVDLHKTRESSVRSVVELDKTEEIAVHTVMKLKNLDTLQFFLLEPIQALQSIPVLCSATWALH